MDVSIEEGVCVDRDAVCVAQDGVVHHLDPGVDGRDGTFVPDDVVEVPTNVPNPLHDVRGTVVDFVSDSQTVNVVRTIFAHGADERADLVIDLGEVGGR